MSEMNDHILAMLEQVSERTTNPDNIEILDELKKFYQENDADSVEQQDRLDFIDTVTLICSDEGHDFYVTEAGVGITENSSPCSHARMSLYLDDQATVTVDVSMLNPVTGEGRVTMRAHPVVDDDVYEIVHALGEFNLVTKMERFLNEAEVSDAVLAVMDSFDIADAKIVSE